MQASPMQPLRAIVQIENSKQRIENRHLKTEEENDKPRHSSCPGLPFENPSRGFTTELAT
jgi:hypothetical protein